MSRSISESVSLLSETLSNCKTALTEKQVADVDSIKISDVDEKILEIDGSGGSSGGSGKRFKNIEPISGFPRYVNDYFYNEVFDPDVAQPFNVNLTFTVTEDDCGMMVYGDQDLEIEPNPTHRFTMYRLTKGTTYTITGSSAYIYYVVIWNDKTGNVDFWGTSSN